MRYLFWSETKAPLPSPHPSQPNRVCWFNCITLWSTKLKLCSNLPPLPIPSFYQNYSGRSHTKAQLPYIALDHTLPKKFSLCMDFPGNFSFLAFLWCLWSHFLSVMCRFLSYCWRFWHSVSQIKILDFCWLHSVGRR